MITALVRHFELGMEKGHNKKAAHFRTANIILIKCKLIKP